MMLAPSVLRGTRRMPSDRAIALAEQAQRAAELRGFTVPVECNQCPATVECVVDDVADERVCYRPAERGALRCAGCGELLCRDCARSHPDPAPCAAEQVAHRQQLQNVRVHTPGTPAGDRREHASATTAPHPHSVVAGAIRLTVVH